jgi:L-asparaginase
MTKLARIRVLTTGGTIAGVAELGATVRYAAGNLSAAALLGAIAGLNQIAQVQVEQIANIGSQNMSHDIWLALAARIRVLMAQENVDGVVITHGTDTMEETAYFLSLVLGREKPVVLVGAMRPADAISADGPGNLIRAVVLASDMRAATYGPLVVMNDTIHCARAVQKVAAAGVVAFASPTGGPVGAMHDMRVVFHNSPPIKVYAQSEADPLYPAFQLAATLRADQLPPVAIVYAHVGMPVTLIDVLANSHAGIVLAGVGEGNAPDLVWQAMGRAVGRGVAVLRSSRCGSGAVVAQSEVDDQKWGTVAAGDLSPQKARILLMLALQINTPPTALQSIFDRY